MAESFALAPPSKGQEEIRLTLHFPLWWWHEDSLESIRKAELQARAFVVLGDRLLGIGAANYCVWADADEMGVDLEVPLSTNLAEIYAWRESVIGELAAIPNLGTAACPCGCGTDLAIRDCYRERVRMQGGHLAIKAPAEEWRDLQHPGHRTHGVLGWEAQPGWGLILACACGEDLRLQVHTLAMVAKESEIPAGGIGSHRKKIADMDTVSRALKALYPNVPDANRGYFVGAVAPPPPPEYYANPTWSEILERDLSGRAALVIPDDGDDT